MNHRMVDSYNLFAGLVLIAILAACPTHAVAQPMQSLPEVIDQVQPAMVKVFGAGGLRRLESWQSGFLVSPDGLIVTVWSYVLDDEETTVVLDNGLRLSAKLVGYHPQFEIALLKADLQEHPCFNLDATASTQSGATVLAFSNLYGVANGNEKCSVQTGIVSTILRLNARRGARKAGYDGPAMILDAIVNNPGAAGGAVTDRSGHLLGMIGRESRSAESGLWLNYAIPADQVAMAINQIRSGKANQPMTGSRKPSEFMTPEMLGLVMVPDVVERTPPFVDQVIRQSAAAIAGVQPDDLVVEINGQVASSCRDLVEKLRLIDRDSSLSMTVQRDGEFLALTLQVTGK